MLLQTRERKLLLCTCIMVNKTSQTACNLQGILFTSFPQTTRPLHVQWRTSSSCVLHFFADQQLLQQLETERADRRDWEAKREDLVRRAKALQRKTQARRNQGVAVFVSEHVHASRAPMNMMQPGPCSLSIPWKDYCFAFQTLPRGGQDLLVSDRIVLRQVLNIYAPKPQS